MSMISDCIRFDEALKERLFSGRHPMSSLLFRGVTPRKTSANDKPEPVANRRPVDNDSVRKASAMRLAGKTWDEVEAAVGFTRPALTKRARLLGLPTSPSTKTHPSRK